jgi:hypothetical protein
LADGEWNQQIYFSVLIEKLKKIGAVEIVDQNKVSEIAENATVLFITLGDELPLDQNAIKKNSSKLHPWF